MPARAALATMVRVGGENVFDQGVNYSWSAIYEVLFSILAGESRGCSSSGYYQPISASGDCMDRNSLVEIRQVENDFTRAHGPMRERDISAIISIIPCFSSKVTHLLLTHAALLIRHVFNFLRFISGTTYFQKGRLDIQYHCRWTLHLPFKVFIPARKKSTKLQANL